jgi:hypothetical protein
MRGLFLIVVAMACTASDSERTRQAAERRQAGDSVLTMQVVQSLMTPASPARLIYERPADLSYDSLRVKRPDLVSAADGQKR